MIRRWVWQWPWRITGNGCRAEQARDDAERRLRETRRQWPQVHRAHDELAAWVDQALRGGA